MPLNCAKCSRVGPTDASYCWSCGFALPGHGGAGGPVAVGAQQFPSAFVFPSGRSCRSFDEMAVACQEDWNAAKELLAEGFFGGFFGGMGRADLARAAEEAKKFGDPDRGLDLLLDKLPSKVLQDPKLRVEPLDVNLGKLEVGQDRDLDVMLENQGMRLLHGKVMAVDTPWLTLGEGQGVSEKIFQFTHETKLTVHVRGNKLRANNKPLEGKLVIDSNGSEPVTVVVRCDVPVKPYPGSGPLAGARTPRQVAEKAKAAAKEAAAAFEKGEVAAWYATNGWTYPVQGPAASGLGAVQQFFEALGLTPPPKVEISHRSVTLSGNPGDQNIRHVLQISTQEKRPVYAHGASNQPWLEVGRAKLNGRTAEIVLTVPTVPDRGNETLTANVTVQSNGNQKFVVPVTLQIGESLDFSSPEPIQSVIPVKAEAPRPKAGPTMPVMTLQAASDPEPLELTAIAPSTPRIRKQSLGMHWLVAAALGLMLVMLAVADIARKPGAPLDPGDSGGPLDTERLLDILTNAKPALRVDFDDKEKRFGIAIKDVPSPINPKEEKLLTTNQKGRTNNTVIKIDDYEFVFGSPLLQRRQAVSYAVQDVVKGAYWTAKVTYAEKDIEVIQHVMLVPSKSSADIKDTKLDNCLIYYTIENKGRTEPKIEARFLLDTQIGSNDAVPFTVPNSKIKGFVDKKAIFEKTDVPDYMEAVENPDDADNPGTVARFGLNLTGLKLPDLNIPELDSKKKPAFDPKTKKPIWRYQYPALDEIESPSRVVICQHPQSTTVRWDFYQNPNEFHDINAGGKKDSCVVLFWPEKRLKPEQKRAFGFTYGLGTLEIEGGKGGTPGLGLSGPTGVIRGQEFTVTAYVYNARAGQRVTLKLPDGFELTGGSESRNVEADGKRVPLHWNIKGTKLGGPFEINVESQGLKAKPVKVRVRENSIFG